MQVMMRTVRAGHAARIRPEVSSPTAARRAAMPYGVECPGLTAHDRGEVFVAEHQGRRMWCRENCRGEFMVEPIRDGTLGQDTGRRFLFADQADAAGFRLRWC